MKANIFLTLISLILAGLIGYWVFSNAEGKEQDMLCGICSTVCFLATLIPAIGLRYESDRIGTNIRVLSGLFFIAFLISHFYSEKSYTKQAAEATSLIYACFHGYCQG